MTESFKLFATEQIPIIDQTMYQFLDETSDSTLLFEAMDYSISAGGKRFRALLVLATVDFFGRTLEKADYEVAAALEMIHTYSLIHDDLPAMDDDDLRRGKPTNHKVFGEAIAILAGDALLTESFHLIASSRLDSSVRTELIRLLAKASGSRGMVAGQVSDILGENKKISLKDLQEMHAKKTGALIQFAVEAGIVLSGQCLDVKKWLMEYAQNIGIAFQIKDDLLDVVGDEVTLGKKTGMDESHNKNTYVSLLGLKGAEQAFERHCELAAESLEKAKRQCYTEQTDTLLDGILKELKVI
ncbi:MAG: polyprenyl synthetase family protein [Vagococcus sp.]